MNSRISSSSFGSNKYDYQTKNDQKIIQNYYTAGHYNEEKHQDLSVHFSLIQTVSVSGKTLPPHAWFHSRRDCVLCPFARKPPESAFLFRQQDAKRRRVKAMLGGTLCPAGNTFVRADL